MTAAWPLALALLLSACGGGEPPCDPPHDGIIDPSCIQPEPQPGIQRTP